MRRLLDPKLDIVFRFLFGDPRNSRLLISLLNAVLQPKVPVMEVTVLNPALPKDAVDDRGIVLDVRAKDAQGHQYDLELQSQSRPAHRERALYYLSQLYGGQLTPGTEYGELLPCHGIWIADFVTLRGERFHSTFRMLEVHEHEEFSDHLDLHWIELPKLPAALARGDEPELLKWARFLKAETDEDLEQVAMIDSDIQAAKEALERLSADPTARLAAERRQMAILTYEAGLNKARREAREEGEALGLRKGRIEALCEVFNIELAPPRRQQLEQSDAAALDALLDHLRVHRSWPEH